MKKILTSNGKPLVKDGKVFLSDGGGAVIKTQRGWKGTTVPNSGKISNIYLNTNLSIDEVREIVSKADLPYEDFVYIVAASDFILEGEEYESLLGIFKLGDNIAIASGINGNLYEVYFNKGVPIAMGVEILGWNPNATLPVPVMGELISENYETAVGTKNDLLSSLFSTTPFIQTNDETISLSGEYDGSPIEVTENGNVDIKALIENGKLPLGVNVNVASSGGVVVVDELPTNPEENVIYQVNEISDIDVYIKTGEALPSTLEVAIKSLGATPNLTYYVVDSLPETPNISNLQTFSPAYVYIYNDIAYTYGNVGTGNMWLGVKDLISSTTNIPHEDKGYVESNLQIEEEGIYVTYKHGSLGVAKKEKYNLKIYDYNDWINYGSIFDKSIEKFSHNTIKEIRSCAFYDCDKLTNVYLPQVRALRYRSFYDCISLKTVYLPKCKYIAQESFYNCKSLTDLYLGADEVVTIPKDTLIINSNHPNVHVRAELLSAYQSDEVWSRYSNLVTLVGDYTD